MAIGREDSHFRGQLNESKGRQEMEPFAAQDFPLPDSPYRGMVTYLQWMDNDIGLGCGANHQDGGQQKAWMNGSRQCLDYLVARCGTGHLMFDNRH